MCFKTNTDKDWDETRNSIVFSAKEVSSKKKEFRTFEQKVRA